MNVDLERKGLYSKSVCSKVHRVVQSVRHIHGKHNLYLPCGSVVVVCLVKNADYYVHTFIEHYLRIGVNHIVLMDNGSSDRTVDIAAKYDRVTVIKCHLPFREYKLAMRTYLAEAYGNNNWCLSVDIDELWEFPFLGSMRLCTFVQYLEESGFTAVVAHQLDLFGEGSITKTGGTDRSLSDLRYFNLSDIYCWWENANNSDRCPDQRLPRFFSENKVSNPNIPVMARGVRWRLFGITPVLTKIPLFKLVQPVTPFVSSSHRIKGAVLADVTCVLLHMLLNQHLFAKAQMCINDASYHNHSTHYRQIAETLSLEPVHLPVCLELYRSVNDLVVLNFLHVSTGFARFAITHGCSIVMDSPACNVRTLSLHVPSKQPWGVFEKY